MAKLFNLGTNKQGLIVYGGEASADFGMVVSEAPTFEEPERKQEVIAVPGRNGSVIFQEDAWNDVPKNYKVWLAPKGEDDLETVVSGVMAWLNSQKGYTRLEDSFAPEIFRLAYYSGGNGFSNDLTLYGEGTLKFTCRAEKFYKTGEEPVDVANGSKLYNPTRFASKPLIHIEVPSSASITLSIGGVSIVATVTDYINIDCETMNAYRLASENKNSSISGAFPTIAPGINNIGITGTITKATIVPRYFTI